MRCTLLRRQARLAKLFAVTAQLPLRVPIPGLIETAGREQKRRRSNEEILEQKITEAWILEARAERTHFRSTGLQAAAPEPAQVKAAHLGPKRREKNADRLGGKT